MSENRSHQGPRIDSAPVELPADWTEDEKQARWTKAIEEVFDKARKPGSMAPRGKLQLHGPFEEQGSHYVSVSFWPEIEGK